MKWTLRKKILVGFGIVLILMVVIVGWSLVSLLRLGRATNAILTENYKSILAAENMIDAIERQDSAILLMILDYDEEGLVQFRQNENQFLQWLGRAKDNITIPGEEKIIGTIEQGYSVYLVDFSNLRLLAGSDRGRAAAFYHETVLPAFKVIRDECIRLREINQETMFAASDLAAQVAHRAIASVLVIGAAAILLGLGFSLLLSHVIVHPLRLLTGATRRLSEGDYDVRVEARSSDELGRLAEDFNTMAGKLKAYKELDVRRILAEKHKSDAIIRSIDDGLVVIDAADLSISGINPTAADIFAVRAEEAVGRHVLEVIKNEHLFERIRATVESREVQNLDEEKRIITVEENETRRHYQFSITAVRPMGEPAASIVLLLRDVTRLRELDRLKSEFVMAASHELRTPLTSIEMGVELLREGASAKLNDKEQQLLAATREEILRLKALVNDLLDISKIEAGKMEMDFARTAVDDLLEKAVAVLKPQAEEKGIELSMKVEGRLPQVRADANKITWVLTNLIANALRYTDQGGYVRLRAERLGPQVHLSVADNGEGIPYAYQSRVFDKFVQVKSERAMGGSGLGLAISKEIVRAHGGTIWIDSTPGRGSTFTFTLPVVE